MPVIQIKQIKGATKAPKVLGRGTGNGRGRTCGRGNKGQKARAGATINPGFEGGQMPIFRRLPKRGFKNVNKVYMNLLNLNSLNGFADGTKVDEAVLLEKGLIKDNGSPVKVLGNGELKAKNLTLSVHAVSETAKSKIEKTGGKVELIAAKKVWSRAEKVKK